MLKPIASRAWNRLLDIVLPPLCPACRAPVGQNGAICAKCWRSLTFIAAPHCARCGVPFELDVEGGDLQCEQCLNEPPRYDRARAPLLYNEASRDLILKFKHGDALQIARSFTPLLTRAGAPLLARADLLVPVPLARGRLWRRRYNQAAVLAQAIGTDLKNAAGGAATLQVANDLLRRVRATPTQGGLNRKERQKNMRGAFALRQACDLTGKIVVLVDDVLTSGATVNECARILLAAGAARVDVLTVARVARGME